MKLFQPSFNRHNMRMRSSRWLGKWRWVHAVTPYFNVTYYPPRIGGTAGAHMVTFRWAWLRIDWIIPDRT